MEILFDNPLANMYGPYFLIFYAFVIFFAVIGILLAKQRLDQTDRLSVPPIPSTIDPYEVAFLRGGENELARSVIFGLVQKGFLEIDTSATPSVIRRTANAPSVAGLTSIEQLSLGWHGSSREPKEIFGRNGLAEQLTNQINFYRHNLEGKQMLVGHAETTKFRLIKAFVLVVIGGLGAYKFVAAIVNGHSNLLLLPLFLITGVILARYVGRAFRITKLGEVYLGRLQSAFEGLKYTAQTENIGGAERPVRSTAAFAGVDPLLLSVGLFGGGILAGTMYDSYNQAFQRGQLSGSSSSGCGSGGCGSCSSGSGDGGSSCGGGCGGCGGGD